MHSLLKLVLAERLRVTADGKVCIAHDSALHSGNLQVSTSSADAIDINSYSSSADNGGRLSFYRSKNATIGSNTIVADGDSLGRIDFRGYNSNGNSYNQGATIEFKVDGSVGSTTDMPTAILFKTSEDGSASPTERLRVAADGKIGIGTDGPDGLLEVYNSSASGNTVLKIHNDKTGDAANLTLEGKRTSSTPNDTGQLLYKNNGYSVAGIFAYSGDGNNNDNGELSFRTSASGSSSVITEALRIKSDGKVGIGDDAPDALLSIKGDSDAATNPSIRLKDGTDTREAWITNAAGDLILANGGNDNTPHCYLKMFDGNIMTFATSNTERLRIGSAGQIGLGGANYGSSGQVLTSNGSGSAPTWQTVSGGGGGGASEINDLSDAKTDNSGDSFLVWELEHFDDGTNIAVAIGKDALNDQTSGNLNCAVGNEAFSLLTTSSQSAAFGVYAGRRATGGSNVFLGYSAGEGVSGSASASYCTAVGEKAMENFTSGNYNSAFGYRSLRNVTTGTHNLSGGVQSSDAVTTGSYNTSWGDLSLSTLTTGSSNIAIGYRAFTTLDTWSHSVAIGRDAGAERSQHNNSTLIGGGW